MVHQEVLTMAPVGKVELELPEWQAVATSWMCSIPLEGSPHPVIVIKRDKYGLY